MVDLNEDIGIAQLFHENMLPYPAHGSTLKVLGWGTADSNGSNTELQTKCVTFNIHTICDIYENRSIIFTDTKNGPYSGDSGGPLIYDNYIFGIVSGVPCNETYSSYSSVDYFYRWIWANIENRRSLNDSCDIDEDVIYKN